LGLVVIAALGIASVADAAEDAQTPPVFSPSVGSISQIAGGAVALGFGVWHFAVPSAFGWWSYVPDAPSTLIEAVDATNFFFSVSLSLIGAVNVVMPLIEERDSTFTQVWLWSNVALWTARAVYQLVKPQGSHNPALRWGMLGAFAATDALFVVSALEASLPGR
jgi:hypothetical protein